MFRLLRSHDCKRDGHRFEPRYDQHVKWPDRITSLSVIDGAALREAFLSTTFIHDICRYCGVRIDRDGKWLHGRP